MESIGIHGIDRFHKKSHSSVSGDPPAPKRDTVQTQIKEPTTSTASSHTAPSTTSTDPAKYPITISVGWLAYDDPPQTPITTRILGTTLRPIFGKHLCSNRDDVVQAPKSFTFYGVAEEGKKKTEIPGGVNPSGWRVNCKKANRQPWTPWVLGMTYETPTPAKETQKESTGKRHKHHKRSRSGCTSSASSGNSVDKDKHKRSRERREKRRHKR